MAYRRMNYDDRKKLAPGDQVYVNPCMWKLVNKYAGMVPPEAKEQDISRGQQFLQEYLEEKIGADALLDIIEADYHGKDINVAGFPVQLTVERVDEIGFLRRTALRIKEFDGIKGEFYYPAELFCVKE